MIKRTIYFKTLNIFTACHCSNFHRLKKYLSTFPVTENQKVLSGEEQAQDARPWESRKRDFEVPENSKLLRVSIVGVPNAGKSTLINALTDFDVCPVSHRPHTTRKNQKAVYLDNETQLVFVDTPGLVSVKEIKKFSFSEEFVYGPEKSFGPSHLIAVIHDISNVRTREKLDFRIKNTLEKFPNKKSILILNKVDQLKNKKELLDSVKYLTSGVVGGKPLPILTFEQKKRQSHLRLNTEDILKNAKTRSLLKQVQDGNRDNEQKAEKLASDLFTPEEIRKGLHQLGWPNFHDIFMISALKGDGIELLRNYMLVNAVRENWIFDASTLTDVPPEKLAMQILKAKLLEYLPQEMPFYVKPVMEHWADNENGELCIRIKIRCPREKYQWRICGSGGSTIARITTETQETLSKLLGRQIKLVVEPVFDKILAREFKNK